MTFVEFLEAHNEGIAIMILGCVAMITGAIGFHK